MSIQCSPYSHTIRGFLYDANDLQQYNAIPGGYNLNVFYRDQNDQSQNFRMVYVGDTRGCGTMCNMKALISAKRAGAESANANCQEQLQMYVNAYGYCR